MTKIEWVKNAAGEQGKTWNPIVGCSIVSPGCTNCYAMKMAARLEAIAEANYDRSKGPIPGHYCGTTKKVNGNVVWTGKVAQAPESTLLEPLHRKKPTMYFVNSMGDLFHEDIPDEWIDRVFAVMALCPHHTFQVLTKRAERMRDYVYAKRSPDAVDTLMNEIAPAHWCKRELDDYNGWPLDNVWLGVSCERQQEADERIPLLLQTPAAIRFISAEPLIGAINLKRIKVADLGWQDVLEGWRDCKDYPGRENVLDWVIVGGESGPKARPMHPDWARKIRDDCAASGVAFFFKQWGEFFPGDDLKVEEAWTEHLFNDDVCVARVGKKRAGRKLDGKSHNEFPKAKAGEARAA